MSEIYSNASVNFLLGIILNEPTLLLNEKYPLDKKDFEPNLFQKIIFASCKNLVLKGCKEIDGVAISEFLSNYKTQEQVYLDNGGMEYISNIRELCEDKIDNYEYYWSNTRKHTLLRELEKNHNISEIWDVDLSQEKNEAKLDSLGIDEIINLFDSDITNIKKEFNSNSNIEEIKLGTWFKDIKDEFMKTPMFGKTLFSDYVNTATRGFIKGQLSIFSMPSGSGKSTIGISTLCRICCKEIWDYELNKYIENPCYEDVGGLYLQYEMDGKYECTPKFVSAISGVPTNHILNGLYADNEEERVDKAIEIMEESNIHIVTMPTFTNTLLENYIKDYRLSHNCQYVVFDYISEQASVNSEVAKKNGVTTRSDMVLATISSNLKDIASQNDVAIMTFTQCNSNIGTQEYMDAGCIAGSRAVQNKADIAGILMPLRPKEEKLVGTFIDASRDRGFNLTLPNRILHLYKVRFGSEEQGIKIWLHIDLSNGHITDCWTTNKDNVPYKMKKTQL